MARFNGRLFEEVNPPVMEQLVDCDVKGCLGQRRFTKHVSRVCTNHNVVVQSSKCPEGARARLIQCRSVGVVKRYRSFVVGASVADTSGHLSPIILNHVCPNQW